MIKNIIFDLGAVILKIDLNAYITELKRLAPNANFEFDHNKYAFYAQYEKGEIDETTFFFEMSAVLNHQVSIKDLKQAWSKILLEPFQESIDFIESVKGEFNLFILSNTNYSHRVQFDQIFDKHWGSNKFYSLFKANYYSYEMGLIKPDNKIYSKVLENESLMAHETLFIDDNDANVQSASKLGIHSWLFKGVNDWKSISEELLQ